MTVGIMVNASKQEARSAVLRVMAALESKQVKVILEEDAAHLIGRNDGHSHENITQLVDLVIVLGGDGTMLSCVAKLDDFTKPIAGINIGTLGFLTSATDDEIDFFADCLVNQNYWISKRSLLQATIHHPNGSEDCYEALNEVVIARGQTGKLVSLKAVLDGELLNHYRADGLIVATPTGSTAYSLSAGGPLVSPNTDVFVITPICPHSLSYRSLIYNDSATMEIIPEGSAEEPMYFTVDGRDIIPICTRTRVTVKKSSRQFQLLRLNDRSFYEALRQKLGWKG